MLNCWWGNFNTQGLYGPNLNLIEITKVFMSTNFTKLWVPVKFTLQSLVPPCIIINSRVCYENDTPPPPQKKKLSNL